MSEHLHHKLAVLQQNLMHGKLPRDLPWDDALSLVSHLGTVESAGNEEFSFVIGESRVPFKRPRTGLLDMEDVSKLRKLLHAGKAAAAPDAAPADKRMIVVVDHHVAHIYEDLGASRPHEVDTIKPADPHHFHHHLIHKKESHYQGDRVPEDPEFYKAITAALVPASQIVVIGHGVGKSNAAVALMEHLRSHRPDVAARVQAEAVADLSALTEPQIEKLAEQHLHPTVQS